MQECKRNQMARARRINRVRAKVNGTADRPRLAVFKSIKHTSVQLIDDSAARTLAAATDQELDVQAKTNNTERAKLVGKLIAERAKEKGISKAVFDRRGNRYHGRIKALADAAREGGLEF